MKQKVYTVNVNGQEVELNEYEVELVRFFAKHYIEKGDMVPYLDLPKSKEVGNKLMDLTNRLFRFGLMGSFTSNAAKIPPKVVELVQQWDNPPLPDYRDKVTKWFFSKRWSILVLLFVVVPPIVIGWITVVQFVIGLFRTTKG